jgi:DNA-binding transcriptional regulator LsrR (DeoR family)
MSSIAQKSKAGERLILKACFQFYRQGLSHTEIAANLRISRFQVARLLRTALEENYVTVKILEPEHWYPELERHLEEEFGLRAALVIDNDDLDEEEAKRRVADAAGRYLLEVLSDGDVLGVSLGSTIRALIEQLPYRIGLPIQVVQLIGGSPRKLSDLSSMILAVQLADRFGTNPHLLYAPAMVNGESARRLLLADPNIRATVRMFKRVTISVLGIGALTTGTTSRLLYEQFIDSELRQQLRDRGAVGDVLSYIYRRDGNILAGSLEDRLIAMPLQDHLKVPYRVGIASGEAKALAIEGAMRAKLINVLVTDSKAAGAICSRMGAVRRGGHSG